MEKEFLNGEIAKFNLADAAIAELSSRYMGLTISDGYEVVHKAKMEVKSRRIDVEKKRKELKEDALRYGQAIDAEAKRLTALLSPIEDHLETEEKVYLDQKAAEKAEKERIAAEKYQARIDRLCSFGATFNGTMFNAYGNVISGKAIEAATDESFEEFIGKIAVAKEADDLRRAEEERVRLEEEARIQQIKAEQEAERARLAEEAERLRLEQEAIEKEKKRLEDEEKARRKAIADAEAERLRQEELERAKKEAAEKAVKEAREKAEKERAAEALRQEKARLAAERKAARAPDKVKLLKLADDLDAFQVPDVKTDDGKAIALWVVTELTALVAELREKAGAL
ncbi:MAG: hypothetical protein BWY42_01641 [Candidatus Omnitrophica bacterium ADurb.Bin277]|nr:MAG: hypothetical protein BWY42_01641 [Candidatus Omnitrophica bacterium ADurb.Bin277]